MFKAESFVMVMVVVSIIPFGIMHQPESIISVFKKQVSHPEIHIPVDVS